MQTNSQAVVSTETAAQTISLKVFGIGTAGVNVLEALIRSGLPPAESVAVSPDPQALGTSSAAEKILLTRGQSSAETLSAILPMENHSSNASNCSRSDRHALASGRALPSAEDSTADSTLHTSALPTPRPSPLAPLTSPSDVIFLIAGLGGVTGTAIIPSLARRAKETGALVLAFVTLPFDCEGSRRQLLAQQGLAELKAAADGVICLPNQKVIKLIDESTSVLDTFKLTNELLADGVRGLWRLLRHTGLIQIHFADLAGLLRDRHAESTFAVADAAGATRSREAVEKLLAHPMLESGQMLAGAEAVLVSLISGPDLTMSEVNRVMEQINKHCERAQVIMGAAIDESFRDRLALTLIASRSDAEEENPVRLPRSNGEELDTQLLTSEPGVRPNSRFVPPAPALPPEKVEQLLTRQSASGSRPRKKIAKMRQGQLPLEIVSKGRFDKSEPTIVKGEDLDVPTYVRRGMSLN